MKLTPEYSLIRLASPDNGLLLDLIDELDEDDDTLDTIAEADTLEDAFATAAGEIIAYAEEIGEDLPLDEVALTHDPNLRSWVEDIRSGVAED
jgi:hypothetical protein